MIVNVNAKMYRTPILSSGVSRRAVSRSGKMFSREMTRPLVLSFAIILTIVTLCAQLLAWQIGNTSERIVQLQGERRAAGSENIQLLATRARLLSKARVVAVAGAKFDLYVPDKGQVHRL